MKQTKNLNKEIADALNSLNEEWKGALAIFKQAKDAGIVIVFGESDDLCEFRGAVNNEIDCFGGGEAYFTTNGLLSNKCDDPDCPYFQEKIKNSTVLKIFWDRDGYSWVYDINVPYETFEVMKDGEKYCKGLVFDLKNCIGEK